MDEKDALWDVLGRARRVEASPYFARKVLHAIREEPQRTSLAMLWRWLVPASICAAAVLGWSIWHTQDASLARFNEAFDAAADLQSLVAYEDMSLWADTN